MEEVRFEANVYALAGGQWRQRKWRSQVMESGPGGIQGLGRVGLGVSVHSVTELSRTWGGLPSYYIDGDLGFRGLNLWQSDDTFIYSPTWNVSRALGRKAVAVPAECWRIRKRLTKIRKARVRLVETKFRFPM